MKKKEIHMVHESLNKTVECDENQYRLSNIKISEVLQNGTINYLPYNRTLLNRDGDDPCIPVVMDPIKIENTGLPTETPENLDAHSERLFFRYIACDSNNNKWSRLYKTEVLKDDSKVYIPHNSTLISLDGNHPCRLTADDYSKIGYIGLSIEKPKTEEPLFRYIGCDPCNNKWSRLYLKERSQDGTIEYTYDSGTLLRKGGNVPCILTAKDYSKIGPTDASSIKISNIIPVVGKPLIRDIGCDACKNKFSTLSRKNILPDGTIKYTLESTDLLSLGADSPCVLTAEDCSNIGPIDTLSIDDFDNIPKSASGCMFTTPSTLLKTDITVGTISSKLRTVAPDSEWFDVDVEGYHGSGKLLSAPNTLLKTDSTIGIVSSVSPTIAPDSEWIDNITPDKLISAYNATTDSTIEVPKYWYSFYNISLAEAVIVIVAFIAIVTCFMIYCGGGKMNSNKENNPEESTPMVGFNFSSNPSVV